jgi:hypothetical protein
MNSTARVFFRRAMSTRVMSTVTTSNSHKPSGDISAVFPSLSGKKPEPLPDRFRDLKLQHARGKEDPLKGSWQRLLASLKGEIAEIKAKGSEVRMAIFDFVVFPIDRQKGDTDRRVLRCGFRQSEK